MTDPITFDSATPRFSLPLLFVGQAQKEAHVNEAHIIADAIMHCAITGEATSPPTTAADGDCWLVGIDGSGAWAGQSGKIACHYSGNWLFITPAIGMRIFDRANGQDRRYHNTWLTPEAPPVPSGGATIDAEARTAVVTLIARLREAGIFPAE
jgi:hypothetical protein